MLTTCHCFRGRGMLRDHAEEGKCKHHFLLISEDKPNVHCGSEFLL